MTPEAIERLDRIVLDKKIVLCEKETGSSHTDGTIEIPWVDPSSPLFIKNVRYSLDILLHELFHQTHRYRVGEDLNIVINGKEEVIKTKEKSTLEQILPSGIILIWDEKQGYIIPPYEMATLDEIQDDLIAMKNVYEGDTNDIKGNEK